MSLNGCLRLEIIFEVTRREQRILGEQFREEERTGRMFPLSEREAARRWALGGWRHRAFWKSRRWPENHP